MWLLWKVRFLGQESSPPSAHNLFFLPLPHLYSDLAWKTVHGIAWLPILRWTKRSFRVQSPFQAARSSPQPACKGNRLKFSGKPTAGSSRNWSRNNTIFGRFEKAKQFRGVRRITRSTRVAFSVLVDTGEVAAIAESVLEGRRHISRNQSIT
jgi:hypothetical protein